MYVNDLTQFWKDDSQANFTALL
jgi:hypothetical protein